MNIYKRILTASLVLSLFALGATSASAHRSPVGCTGSGLGITLSTNVTQAHIGDLISYSLTVFNGLPGDPAVCDASGIQAFLVTPDGINHPITLKRTALSSGESDVYLTVVPYLVRAQDAQLNGMLMATASDTGDIHQNVTDSTGGGNQGSNVKLIAVVIPPAIIVSGGGGGFATLPIIKIIKTANPSSLPNGPGSVTFTYVVTNASTVAMHGVWLTDDKCTPAQLISGDTNTNSLLDITETWTYTCTKIVTQSEINTATTHGAANGWDSYATALATVLVATTTPPVITTVPVIIIAPAIVPLAHFPNTGFPPKVTNAKNTIGLPTELIIPKIKVDATIEHLGLAADGSMATPVGPAHVAWYSLGVRPGQVGTSVIAGHYGWSKGKPAAFDNLHSLVKGDTISVRDEFGVTTSFVVREVKTYGENADASAVFASTSGSHLNLITCQGIWNAATHSYSERFVVFTDKI